MLDKFNLIFFLGFKALRLGALEKELELWCNWQASGCFRLCEANRQ